MFENSLVISQVNRASSSQRWTAFASMGLQFAVASLILALPLLHPEKMPFQISAPRLLMPLPVKPPVPLKPVQASSGSPDMAASIVAQPRMAMPILPTLFPRQADDRPSLSTIPFAMGSADGIPKAAGTGAGPEVSISAVHPANKQVRISSGVADGLLITPIRPVYPSIAKAARVQGTVVVAAIISRMGTIDNMRVISGPVMLQQAALDAIRAARYQPFQLNGSPTEVQTTISVNFWLGN